MQIKVRIKDLNQDITHEVTGIGKDKHACNVNALNQLKRLLGHHNFEIMSNPKPKRYPISELPDRWLGNKRTNAPR